MTPLLAAAVAVGLATGWLRGGRLSRILRARIGWGWLLIGGAGVQALVLDGAIPARGTAELAIVLVSYAALAGFALLNLGRPGMGVLLIGVALNAMPIAVDGGMPVEPAAIVSAGVAHPTEIAFLDFGGKRHLATSADHLRGIDDAIPDWISHQVLSLGDLVITLGVAAVVAGLLDPRRRTRRRRPALVGGRALHPLGLSPRASPGTPPSVGATGRRATG